MDLTKEVLIYSGEGDNGSWERYFGARTEKAIRSKLSRERCHGDRWAQAWVIAEKYSDGSGWPVYQRFDGEGMRSVNPALVWENPAAMLRAGKTNQASVSNGRLGGRPIIEMLSDDGQGNQLWRNGQGLANVYRADDGQIEITTDIDGWDPDSLGYRKATPRQIEQIRARLQ